jgi:hypothetical protein
VLTAQEIRNCVYRGDFNASLKEQAKYSHLNELVGSSGSKRMVAEELILRFLALHSRLAEYRPPLRQFLNRYMRDRRAMPMSSDEIVLFTDCVDAALEVFGPAAFRVPDRTGTVHNTVNKALYDAVMIPIANCDRGLLRSKKADLADLLPTLLENEGFRGSLGRATADRKRVFTRIHDVSVALKARGIHTSALELVAPEVR